MSVLNAVLAIQSFRASHPDASPETSVAVLARGPGGNSGFAYDRALELIAVHPLCAEPSTASRATRLRELVEYLVVRLRPRWTGLIPKGRGFLGTYLPPAAKQCLDAAGLYDGEPADDVLACWDRLNAIFRAEIDVARTATGRKGERMTLELEAQQLAEAGRPDLVPAWVSLDDNTLGYDIRSYQVPAGGGAPVPRYIEVKASEMTPPRFFLSRSEWETAQELERYYMLHVWHLPSRTYTPVNVHALRSHIPSDQGWGRWQRVEISFGSPV